MGHMTVPGGAGTSHEYHESFSRVMGVGMDPYHSKLPVCVTHNSPLLLALVGTPVTWALESPYFRAVETE